MYFTFDLVGILSILILSVKNRGVGVLSGGSGGAGWGAWGCWVGGVGGAGGAVA